jgi:hypothetical protein
MKIVYATGQPRCFEFGTASNRRLVPEDATVFAVIDGERTESRLDEHIFNAMTDEEYYELQGLIYEARQSEFDSGILV